MRNVFDQYSQWENRLTHALVSTLNNDRKLLSAFLKDFVKIPYRGKGVKLLEQRFPGELEGDEGETEKRGIPDAWVYKENDWVLLVENKAELLPKLDQLNRHKRIAERFGFKKIHLLLLTVKQPDWRDKPWITVRYWEDLYEWIHKRGHKSAWSMVLKEYLEIAERRMVEEKHLKEGSLTKFSGITFSNDNPYSYTEAKRLLKLMQEELKANKRLFSGLGLHAPKNAEGRAITGSKSDAVWDMFKFKYFAERAHNEAPHCTLVINRDRVTADLNLPNKMKPAFGSILRKKGGDEFLRALSKVSTSMEKKIVVKGGVPYVQVLQRRYKTQRSTPDIDGMMEFDLRTFFGERNVAVNPHFKGQKPPKVQKEWVNAWMEMAMHRKSNLNFAIGVKFPYASCSATATSGLANLVAESWICCKPVVDYLIKNR